MDIRVTNWSHWCRIFIAFLVPICGVVLPDGGAAEESERAPVACTPEAVSGGVECRSEDEVEWEITHPSLWASQQAFVEGQQAPPPVGPVEVEERVFYGVHRDLMEVDIREGVVASRARFPARITGLDTVEDGRLEVTVEDGSESATEQATIRHVPGSSSPPRVASSLEALAAQIMTSNDARWLAASAGDPEQAMEWLEQARQIDETNPFFSHVLGTLLQDAGSQEAAMKAFSEAANSSEAPWEDLLRLSGLLDGAGASQESTRAFEMSVEKLEDLGLDPDRVLSLLPMATTLLGGAADFDRLVDAFESGDYRELERLALELASTFDIGAEGPWDWDSLVRWVEADGMGGLTREMERIADENRRAAFEIVKIRIAEVDRLVLAFASLALGLVLLAIMIGFRAGVARRRLFEADGCGTAALWVPRPRWRDFAVPLVLAVALVAVPYKLNTHVMVVDEFASIPVANLQDGLGSPGAQDWLLEMAESPIVRDFVTSILADQKRLAEGGEVEPRTPIIVELVDEAYEDAAQAQWDLLARGEMPDLIAAVALIDADPQHFEAPGGMSLGWLVVPVGAWLLLFFLASVVGARAPGLVRPLLLVVPGGPRRLVPIGALMLVALVAALLALAGADYIVEPLVIDEVRVQLGIAEIDQFATAPSRVWAWITLGVVVAMQAVIASWEFFGGRD